MQWVEYTSENGARYRKSSQPKVNPWWQVFHYDKGWVAISGTPSYEVTPVIPTEK